MSDLPSVRPAADLLSGRRRRLKGENGWFRAARAAACCFHAALWTNSLAKGFSFLDFVNHFFLFYHKTRQRPTLFSPSPHLLWSFQKDGIRLAGKGSKKGGTALLAVPPISVSKKIPCRFNRQHKAGKEAKPSLRFSRAQRAVTAGGTADRSTCLHSSRRNADGRRPPPQREPRRAGRADRPGPRYPLPSRRFHPRRSSAVPAGPA